MALERHLYPGNNTTEGFFSYYQYILGQKEANKIICIKGGPGVGKSTFMRKIGEEFLQQGEDVDFMHCSSDPGSLDGIVLKNKRIAFIDGTAPHVVDPINPGAVDSIIHLGDYWNEDGIRENKIPLIESNEKIKKWFTYTYNYLAAAGKMYDNLNLIYDTAIESAEIYKLAASIVGEELAHKEICLKPGSIKKYFASAITPSGFENYISSLITGYERVYLMSVPVGVSNERFLNIFTESAVYRGMNVEQYYCPLKPATKLEHLLIPDLKVAFLTVNSYHDLEPWEIAGEDEDAPAPQVLLNDMSDVIQWNKLESMREVLDESQEKMKQLLERGIQCLAKAKKEHDILEKYYIPNMDFGKIEALRQEVVAKIK